MKKLFLVVITLILMLGSIKIVNAVSVFENRFTNIYYERLGGVNENYLQWAQYGVDDDIAYCIDPTLDIKGQGYVGTSDFSLSNYSEETIDKVLLYAYYGYGYNDQFDIEYRMAAQKLIWEEVSVHTFIFYDTFKNEKINLDDEINDILMHVNNHNTLPSFAGNSYKSIAYHNIILNDTNNVINNYETSSNNMNYFGDTLSYDAMDAGKDSITFKQKDYYEKNAMLFYYEDSQSLITVGNIKTNSFSVNFDVYNSNVEINKYGQNLSIENNETKYESYKPENVEFELYASEDILLNNEIYYPKDSLIATVLTDKDGQINLENYPVGKYYLKEIGYIENHLINDDNIYFEISYEKLNITLDVFNEYQKGDVIINHYNLLDGSKIGGTVVYLYNEEGLFLKDLVLDENGYLEVYNLPVGKYYIKQIRINDEYKLTNDIYEFEIIKHGYDAEVNMYSQNIISIPDTLTYETNILIIPLIILGMFSIYLIIKKITHNKYKSIIYFSAMATMILINFIICDTSISYSYNPSEHNTISTVDKKEVINNISKNIESNNSLMALKIDKINLEKDIYPLTSTLNDVDINLELIAPSNMPDVDKGTLIIAGHSGEGSNTYFNDLDNLTKGDIAIIDYNNKDYIYNLTEIYDINKNGFLEIKKDINETSLVLVTCKKNSLKQTVYIFNQ